MSNDELKAIYQYLRNLGTITKDLRAMVDVLAWVANRFDKAVDRIEGFAAIDDVLREQSEYLVENIDRLDRMFLVILERLPPRDDEDPLPDDEFKWLQKETAELKKETIENRKRSLRVQIGFHQNNINQLEEQEAATGPDFKITNQLIREREALEQKRKDLQTLRKLK